METRYMMKSQEKTIDELEAMPDSEIDYSDIPATDESFWETAKIVDPKTNQKLSFPNRKNTPNEPQRQAP